jgi:hypothetical protein
MIHADWYAASNQQIRQTLCHLMALYTRFAATMHHNTIINDHETKISMLKYFAAIDEHLLRWDLKKAKTVII